MTRILDALWFAVCTMAALSFAYGTAVHFAAGGLHTATVGAALTLFSTVSAVRAWRSDRPRGERPRGPVHHGAGTVRTTWDGGLVHIHIKTDTGVEWTSVMEPDVAERCGAGMMVASTYARGEVREAGWHAPNGARVIIWPAGKRTADGATIDVAPEQAGEVVALSGRAGAA